MGEIEGFLKGGEAPQSGWESLLGCRGSGGKGSLGMSVWLGLGGKVWMDGRRKRETEGELKGSPFGHGDGSGVSFWDGVSGGNLYFS